MTKEVPRALLVHEIEQRAACNKQHHDNDACLHNGGRDKRRKLCEWVACQHE
jgi:hypothetical protein